MAIITLFTVPVDFSVFSSSFVHWDQVTDTVVLRSTRGWQRNRHDLLILAGDGRTPKQMSIPIWAPGPYSALQDGAAVVGGKFWTFWVEGTNLTAVVFDLLNHPGHEAARVELLLDWSCTITVHVCGKWILVQPISSTECVICDTETLTMRRLDGIVAHPKPNEEWIVSDDDGRLRIQQCCYWKPPSPPLPPGAWAMGVSDTGIMKAVHGNCIITVRLQPVLRHLWIGACVM